MDQRTIAEESQKNIAIMDVFSKLIQDRIIFIDEEITDELANGVIAQLLYLNSVDPNGLINIYINTRGGFVTQGLAIYDVSKIITAPIRTVCIGQAASMGAILMLMGKTRCGLKHSRFMLHQISGGTVGSLTDMQIAIKEADTLQTFIYNILKEHTTIKDIDQALKDDVWLSSEEALACGLITEIL